MPRNNEDYIYLWGKIFESIKHNNPKGIFLLETPSSVERNVMCSGQEYETER